MGWIQVGETRQFVEPCVERLIDDLKAENKRLQEALKKIAFVDYRGHPSTERSIAYAALQGEKCA